MKWEDIKTYSDAVIYRNEQDLYTSINGFDTEEEAEMGMINNEWKSVETLKKLKFIARLRAIEILEYYKNEQDMNSNTPFSLEDYEIALEGLR